MNKTPFAELDEIASLHLLRVYRDSRFIAWRERWEPEILEWREDSICLRILLESHQELVDRLEAVKDWLGKIIDGVDFYTASHIIVKTSDIEELRVAVEDE